MKIKKILYFCFIMIFIIFNGVSLPPPPPPFPPPLPPPPPPRVRVITTMNISVNSNPQGAFFIINGDSSRTYGPTPVVLNMRNGETYSLTFFMNDFRTKTINYRCNGSSISVSLDFINGDNNRRVVPDNRRVVPPDNRRVVPDNRRVVPDNRRVVPDNRRGDGNNRR